MRGSTEYCMNMMKKYLLYFKLLLVVKQVLGQEAVI